MRRLHGTLQALFREVINEVTITRFFIVGAGLVSARCFMRHFLFLFFLLPCLLQAQVKDNGQRSFAKSIPPGNYSGITWLGGNHYAVVDDKSAYDGFTLLRIDVNPTTGRLQNAVFEDFRHCGKGNRDGEGIVYVPSTNTMFISGEADNEICEYRMDGERTGRKMTIPEEFKGMKGNRGFESLAYNGNTHLFWTMNEDALPQDEDGVLRLQAFDEQLQPVNQYLYKMDLPKAKKKAQHYAFGVSEVTALDNGRLLILEREFFVPKKKIGSFVGCKIYEVEPSHETPYLEKRLVHSWRTKLNITNRSFANYEGMCLGPKLANGGQVLLLVSDSQNQYAGILKDYFRTIVLW